MDLITRVRTLTLYQRLIASAKKTASFPFDAHFELDVDNLPKIAATYNRLAEASTSDLLCFVHDDIEFLSDNWDGVVEDIFAEYDVDVLGVVGSTKYNGGRVFDSGHAYMLGHFACEVDQIPVIKILSKAFRYAPAAVVDGMLMFCRKSYWKKEKFDETFDELFFYDTDFCLRGKTGVTGNITVKHSKPKELYGKYPENLKPMEFYAPLLNEKHGITPQPPSPQPCAAVLLGDFKTMGQNYVFDQFQRKLKQECVSQ